ncbi:hypothetical protein SEVCU118_2458 [Staphylococcus epidermidis VCU118]|nr:hypothetical protein SEVCU118_2458 [Staphylococcus epidermidis VCU118]
MPILIFVPILNGTRLKLRAPMYLGVYIPTLENKNGTDDPLGE